MAAVARLLKRADFVAARRGRRVESRCFTLQTFRRLAVTQTSSPRLGLTVTKKVGGAVERNRIRRRLREAVRRADAIPFRPDFDYVLVARREALTEAFTNLQQAVRKAVETAHAPRAERPARQADPSSP